MERSFGVAIESLLTGFELFAVVALFIPIISHVGKAKVENVSFLDLSLFEDFLDGEEIIGVDGELVQAGDDIEVGVGVDFADFVWGEVCRRLEV